MAVFLPVSRSRCQPSSARRPDRAGSVSSSKAFFRFRLCSVKCHRFRVSLQVTLKLLLAAAFAILLLSPIDPHVHQRGYTWARSLPANRTPQFQNARWSHPGEKPIIVSANPAFCRTPAGQLFTTVLNRCFQLEVGSITLNSATRVTARAATRPRSAWLGNSAFKAFTCNGAFTRLFLFHSREWCAQTLRNMLMLLNQVTSTFSSKPKAVAIAFLCEICRFAYR